MSKNKSELAYKVLMLIFGVASLAGEVFLRIKGKSFDIATSIGTFPGLFSLGVSMLVLFFAPVLWKQYSKLRSAKRKELENAIRQQIKEEEDKK